MKLILCFYLSQAEPGSQVIFQSEEEMKDINVLLPTGLSSNPELSYYNWFSTLLSVTDRPTLVRSQVTTVPRYHGTTVPRYHTLDKVRPSGVVRL